MATTAPAVAPAQLARQGLVRAYFEIVRPEVLANPAERFIPLRFNPTEYRLRKTNSFAEIAIPGLETPPIQYVRGSSETLSLEVLLDTSDTLQDVQEMYVKKLRNLMNIDGKELGPPIVSFVWERSVFTGVLENLEATYVLFSPEGTPLRAKVSLSLKEFRPAALQVRERPKESCEVDRSYLARAGDTLSSIAGALYRDPANWREIARANGIQDPRNMRPGQVLTVPRIR